MRSGRRLSFPGEDAHMAGEYRQRPRLDSGSPGNIRGVESYQRFFGAALFGGLSILGLRLQAMGFNVSQYLVDMIPYVATILIVIFSTYKKKKESQPPADLGNNYFREER